MEAMLAVVFHGLSVVRFQQGRANEGQAAHCKAADFGAYRNVVVTEHDLNEAWGV